VADAPQKAAGAFRTIGEVSRDLGVAQHILRYWETKFPQLRPLQRAGGRRYYRPEDMALVRRIDTLLNSEGYTIAGVQKLLVEEAKGRRARVDLSADPAPIAAIRDALAHALDEDQID
jgi:DNA-binding transcriptional MerR regulator